MSNALYIRAIEFRELEAEPTDFPADGCSEFGFVWSDNDSDGRVTAASDTELRFRREVNLIRSRQTLEWLYRNGGGEFGEALRSAAKNGHPVELCGRNVRPGTIAAVLEAGDSGGE